MAGKMAVPFCALNHWVLGGNGMLLMNRTLLKLAKRPLGMDYFHCRV